MASKAQIKWVGHIIGRIFRSAAEIDNDSDAKERRMMNNDGAQPCWIV